MTWPWTPPAPPPPPPKPTAKVAPVMTEDDYKALYVASAKRGTYAAVGVLGLGLLAPNAAFTGMLSTFALSGVIGYQLVWGVAHSLHSPLMAVTNAVSGMTAVGGMYVMGGGLLPSTTAQGLAALATGISAVNITGGFLVTKKMLDMFKRPDDPPEFYEYYGVPAAALLAGYTATSLMGYELMSPTVATCAALGCIGGIAGLASQKTARLGLVSGQCGVLFGLAATIGSLDWPMTNYIQLAGVLGGGGGLGYLIAQRVSPTSLPQTVAAFHSLVGLAAVFTGVGAFLEPCAEPFLRPSDRLGSPLTALHVMLSTGDFLEHAANQPEALDGLRCSAIALATVIGGVTATGSFVAFGKLNGNMSSAALTLAQRDQINIGMGIGTLSCMALFVAKPTLATGTLCMPLIGSDRL